MSVYLWDHVQEAVTVTASAQDWDDEVYSVPEYLNQLLMALLSIFL